MSDAAGGYRRNYSVRQVQETPQAADSDQMNNLLSLNKAKPSGSAAERLYQPPHSEDSLLRSQVHFYAS